MTKRRWGRKRQRIVVPRPKRLRDSRPRRRNKRRRASDEWLTRVYADTRHPRRETFSINYVLETGRGRDVDSDASWPVLYPSQLHDARIPRLFSLISLREIGTPEGFGESFAIVNAGDFSSQLRNCRFIFYGTVKEYRQRIDKEYSFWDIIVTSLSRLF